MPNSQHHRFITEPLNPSPQFVLCDRRKAKGSPCGRFPWSGWDPIAGHQWHTFKISQQWLEPSATSNWHLWYPVVPIFSWVYRRMDPWRIRSMVGTAKKRNLFNQSIVVPNTFLLTHTTNWGVIWCDPNCYSYIYRIYPCHKKSRVLRTVWHRLTTFFSTEKKEHPTFSEPIDPAWGLGFPSLQRHGPYALGCCGGGVGKTLGKADDFIIIFYMLIRDWTVEKLWEYMGT